jgi:OFA family oxalate/formate antiporter-like MFS transporter
LGNAIGRILWGASFDRLPSATAIQVNLICQAVILLCARWILQSSTGLLVFALLTGFNYGGVLVIYASSAARAWGNRHVGQV